MLSSFLSEREGGGAILSLFLSVTRCPSHTPYTRDHLFPFVEKLAGECVYFGSRWIIRLCVRWGVTHSINTHPPAHPITPPPHNAAISHDCPHTCARAHTHTFIRTHTQKHAHTREQYHGIGEDEFHVFCALLVRWDRTDGPVVVPRLDPGLKYTCACAVLVHVCIRMHGGACTAQRHPRLKQSAAHTRWRRGQKHAICACWARTRTTSTDTHTCTHTLRSHAQRMPTWIVPRSMGLFTTS